MLPHYTPMAPAFVREPFYRDGWVYEEKVDGWRTLAYKEGNRVRLVSRNRVDQTRRYPDVAAAAAVARLKPRTLVLDGLLVPPERAPRTLYHELGMLLIAGTDAWRRAHPGAAIGLLELSGVNNAAAPRELNDRKRETEAALRARYRGLGRPALSALPVIAAYGRYYKRFNKTYHVQLQLESIVAKGKSLPDVSPLVDANFIAEVETLVLTAGHDAAKLHEPVSIDVSREGDEIAQMTGGTKRIRPGDMMMRDADGICCSILYGQDDRSPITPATSHVLYVAYAPVGISADIVNVQLQRIESNVRLFSPAMSIEQHTVLAA